MKPKHAFPKSARLLTSEGFSYVFDHVDHKVSSKHVLVLARKNTTSSARLGLIVAKKHVKHAVQRNRLKRVCRETFRLHQSQLPAYDLVVLFKAGSGQADNARLIQDFAYLWRKLKQRTQGKDTKPTQQGTSSQ